MTTTTVTRRYRATTLTDVIDAQGRRRDWVAQQAGIEPPLLSHLERGRRTVTEEVAQRIAAALGIPFEILFVSTEPDTLYAQE